MESLRVSDSDLGKQLSSAYTGDQSFAITRRQLEALEIAEVVKQLDSLLLAGSTTWAISQIRDFPCKRRHISTRYYWCGCKGGYQPN